MTFYSDGYKAGTAIATLKSWVIYTTIVSDRISNRNCDWYYKVTIVKLKREYTKQNDNYTKL